MIVPRNEVLLMHSTVRLAPAYYERLCYNQFDLDLLERLQWTPPSILSVAVEGDHTLDKHSVQLIGLQQRRDVIYQNLFVGVNLGYRLEPPLFRVQGFQASAPPPLFVANKITSNKNKTVYFQNVGYM